MAEEKLENNNVERQDNCDLEKQENAKNLEQEENNEPLETIKIKPPPGINGSLIMLYAVFFSMFTLGWVNLNSCSVNRLIPIYLIVAGFVGTTAKLISKTRNKFVFDITIILVVFYIIWNILGSYWVYSEYQPNYDPKLGEYCNRTAYLLAFWILTLQYTVIGFMILYCGCYLLMKGDFQKK